MIHALRVHDGHARSRLPACGWARWCLALMFWLAAIGGAAGEMEAYCLLIEPKDGPGVKRLVKGGKETALVPGKETNVGGVRYYTKAEFDALGLGWEGFLRKAEATAERVWSTLKPEIVKDAKGFERSAVVRGKGHLTASAILAPGFYQRFRKTMGDDLVILIPDRFTIHVFPRPMGEYKALGPEILEAYAAATYPVSYEVLLLNKEGLSVLGSFRTQ